MLACASRLGFRRPPASRAARLQRSGAGGLLPVQNHGRNSGETAANQEHHRRSTTARRMTAAPTRCPRDKGHPARYAGPGDSPPVTARSNAEGQARLSSSVSPAWSSTQRLATNYCQRVKKPSSLHSTAPYLLDSMVYYLTSGVFCYAKRSTKQTIHAGIQEAGRSKPCRKRN